MNTPHSPNLPKNIVIRNCFLTGEDDNLIAEHFYNMWIDMGYPSSSIVPDWKERTVQFLQDARLRLGGASFLAIDTLDGNKVVGSVSLNTWQGFHPEVFFSTARNPYYIWGVYVLPSYRRRGIGSLLTQACLDHCREVKATKVRLFASKDGRPVYEKLGFRDGNNGLVFDLGEEPPNHT